MERTNYVFALSNYQNADYEEYTVVYIAPKNYWDVVRDLQNYKEVVEGELRRKLVLACGDDLDCWDVVHWYSTKDKDAEDIEEMLINAGMEKSDTLKEYADGEIQEFGDHYIEELY